MVESLPGIKHFILYDFSNKMDRNPTKVSTFKFVVMCENRKSRKTSQIPSSRGAEIRFSKIILFTDSTNYSGKPRPIQVEFPSLRYVSLYSSMHNRKLRLIFVNVCKHSYNKYMLPWQPACMQRYTKSSFFYATCRSAISWEVPVLNQCTSDKKMLVFSYISLVSSCLFSMVLAKNINYSLPKAMGQPDHVTKFL